jgi:hypothetical protein
MTTMEDNVTYSLLHPERIDTLLFLHQTTITKILTTIKERIEQVQKNQTVNVNNTTGSSSKNLEHAALLAPLDELYVLRYVLSAISSSSSNPSSNPSSPTNNTSNNSIIESISIENIWKTLLWRSQHLQDLENAKRGIIKYKSETQQFLKHCVLGNLGGLHPTVLARLGHSSMKGICELFTHDQMVENSLLLNEYAYHLCDVKTRETGLLCKEIAVIDLANFSVMDFDRRFAKAVGESSHLSQLYYPQLLGKTIILNMPTLLRIAFKAMRLVMPAKSIEKQSICPGSLIIQNENGTKKVQCPFLSKFDNGIDIIPKYLGGKSDMLMENE